MTRRLLPALLLTSLAAPLPASAQDLRQAVQSCLDLADAQLASCLRNLPGLKTADHGQAQTKPSLAATSSGQERKEQNDLAPTQSVPVSLSQAFARQWALNDAAEAPCLKNICAYRPSYLIARNSDAPNAWPSSPAAGHSLSAPVAHAPNEMKFQLSFKSLLAQAADGDWQLWAAYSQQSHWQVFDTPHSRPFRETDYEPEILLNRRLAQGAPLSLRMLGVGVAHQSNGQSNPLSRSWNRSFVQAGFADGDWWLLTRVWKRWHENAEDDDNPGVEDYIGRAEATLSWAPGANKASGQIVSLRLRHSLNPSAGHGSAQLEWSAPVSAKDHFRWFVQAFRGYGESLLDYNHAQTTIGVGIGILNWP